MSREKRKERKRLPEDDDGRVIAPMDVDGMPWSTRGVRDPFRRREREDADDRPPMSRDERRGFILAAVGSALLIGAVFAAAYGLFLLFCRFVWLR